MGFWHTGYIEFHEPVGLGTWNPTPPVYACPHCESVFSTCEALQDHRFEAHPLRRPLLFVRGDEVGTQPIRITTALSPADIRVEHCERASINGDAIPLARLAGALARTVSDAVRLTLSKQGVEATFELDFRIASESDLAGVEDEFRRTAQARRLDTRAIDEFILATRPFGTGVGYCDGICAYLYGVLAKERTGGATLPFEAYGGKFNKAAEELSAYERPLARTIRALVAFHFNHFQDAFRQASATSRLARAAARYARWLGGESLSVCSASTIPMNDAVEALVTDWDTEQILRFANRTLADLAAQASDVEALLSRDLVEYDRVKLRVLLAHAYADSGSREDAGRHAKALWNVPRFEQWAQNILSRDQNESL